MKALLLLSLPLLLAACTSQTCTLMHAPDNVDVQLVADSWAPGTYEVEALGEICTVVLPAVTDPSCSGTVLGLALSEDDSGLASVTLWEAAPDAFDLTIRLDGVELLSEEVVPSYVEDEPNGEGCGIRRSGTASISLD